MKTAVIVPPIKCQGIKTKLVSSIKSLADQQNFDRWIEPLCGSGVVAFNLQPKKTLY
jgi:DNA adenine methylase